MAASHVRRICGKDIFLQSKFYLLKLTNVFFVEQCSLEQALRWERNKEIKWRLTFFLLSSRKACSQANTILICWSDMYCLFSRKKRSWKVLLTKDSFKKVTCSFMRCLREIKVGLGCFARCRLSWDNSLFEKLLLCANRRIQKLGDIWRFRFISDKLAYINRRFSSSARETC